MGIFTSKGFSPEKDLPDLTGKVILITGAKYVRIGYATVKHLARKGAKIYMAARNKAKAEAAIAQLQSEGLGPGNGEVVWLELDLCDPRNAKKAAREFMSKEDRLDVLIHNAAAVVEPYEILPDGIQSVMVVKYDPSVSPSTLDHPDFTPFSLISPFVLTRELLPLLRKTASQPDSDVRIVVVASEGHRMVSGNPRFRTIENLNEECKGAFIPWFARYCLSKLTNILYASELHRRLSSSTDPATSNITTLSLDPGNVNTFSHKPELARFHLSSLVSFLAYPFFVSPDIGAYNSAFAAAAPVVQKERGLYGGSYIVPVGKVVRPGGGLWRSFFGGKGVKEGGEKDVEEQEWEENGKEMWETVEKLLEEKEI
ncbi:hypothetical protein ID866_8642 [Astraeus odoratus]|nr:hypothetical protein ID866_8642 [Astraeus odoratus]